MLEMDHLIHTVWLSGEFSIGCMIEMRQCIIRSVTNSNIFYFYFLNLQHDENFIYYGNFISITFKYTNGTTELSID